MFKLSIKTYMIIFLLLLAILGIYQQKDFITLLLQLSTSVSLAIVLDLAINYFQSKKVIFPSSAIITGLIVGMVLFPGQNLVYYVSASSLAILSKHILKFNHKHIFNPACFGLSLVNIFSGATLGWWSVNIYFLIIPGLLIAFKVKRLHLVLSYLLVFMILLMSYAYLKQERIFDYLALINLYFVFVMLIEPKTSPFKFLRGIIFGSTVGFMSFLLYVIQFPYDYLVVSLLVGNLSAFAPACRVIFGGNAK